jgi:hypothetical protein
VLKNLFGGIYMIKRISITVLITVMLLISATSANATFAANGWISYYYGVGTVVNGHTLGDYDCATKIGFDNPISGTQILAVNLDNQKTQYVYKWDTGSMGGSSSSIILDVMPTVFKLLSNDGTLSSGYIYNGRYVR